MKRQIPARGVLPFERLIGGDGIAVYEALVGVTEDIGDIRSVDCDNHS